MRVVVDASAVSGLVLSRGRGEQIARAIANRAVFAPQLRVPAVLSALRGWVLGGRLGPERAAGALDDFRDLDITLIDMVTFIDDVWRLRNSITAYDALYVALARTMRCPLLTLDMKLVAALPPDILSLIHI